MRLSMLVLLLPLLMQQDGSGIVAMWGQIPLRKPLPKALQEGGLNLLGYRCKLTVLALVPTMVNGAIVLILFVGAPISSTVSSVINLITTAQGVVPQQSDTLQNITTVVNLIMPPDALWHGAAYYLLPTAALDFLPTQGYSAGILDIPFISPQPISIPLLIWVAFYCVVLPVLAVCHFHYRVL